MGKLSTGYLSKLVQHIRERDPEMYNRLGVKPYSCYVKTLGTIMRKGQDAFLKGNSRDSCPYNYKPFRQAWFDGFDWCTDGSAPLH